MCVLCGVTNVTLFGGFGFIVVGFICNNVIIWAILVFGFWWLVGAFSVLGRLDTGNPVQILWVLGNFALFLEF